MLERHIGSASNNGFIDRLYARNRFQTNWTFLIDKIVDKDTLDVTRETKTVESSGIL